jgi:hypothetical protein
MELRELNRQLGMKMPEVEDEEPIREARITLDQITADMREIAGV